MIMQCVSYVYQMIHVTLLLESGELVVADDLAPICQQIICTHQVDKGQ